MDIHKILTEEGRLLQKLVEVDNAFRKLLFHQFLCLTEEVKHLYSTIYVHEKEHFLPCILALIMKTHENTVKISDKKNTTNNKINNYTVK